MQMYQRFELTGNLRWICYRHPQCNSSQLYCMLWWLCLSDESSAQVLTQQRMAQVWPCNSIFLFQFMGIYIFLSSFASVSSDFISKWLIPLLMASMLVALWNEKKNSIVVNSNPIVAHSAQFSHYTVRQYCLARIFCSPLIKLKGIHENPTEDLLYTPTFKNIIIIVSLNNAATITQKHSRDCCCLIQQMDFWANKQSPEKIVWNVELYSDSGAFRVKLHLWQTSLLADGKKITTSAPVW